jgi:hypothetical protein
MFETLFGSGMPLAVRFFIAFLVVLGLIGVTAWLVRRFGASRLGGGAARGRQPRLAVIDAAAVDGRRRLVLIRRDNIEHLLMIGGPSDVVVEANIVRAAAARDSREPARAGFGSDSPARTTPAPENAWPLQPLGEPSQVSPARSYRGAATDEPWLAPEPGARPRPADNLTAEPPPRATPPDIAPIPRSEPTPLRSEPAPRANVTGEPPAAPQTDRNLAEMAQQLEAALRRSPNAEGRPPVTDPLAVPAKAAEAPARAALREFKPRLEPKFESKPEPKLEPKFDAKFDAKNEQKPEPKFELKAEPKFEPKFEAKPQPKVEPKLEAKFEPAPQPKAEPKPEPKVEVKPAPKVEVRPDPSTGPGKAFYDNLEEEMASLLGRPPGKT